jgi:hypothetical protein
MRLTVVAIEGQLPAYGTSLGEVDEIKREKDLGRDRLGAEELQPAGEGDGAEVEPKALFIESETFSVHRRSSVRPRSRAFDDHFRGWLTVT